MGTFCSHTLGAPVRIRPLTKTQKVECSNETSISVNRMSFCARGLHPLFPAGWEHISKSPKKRGTQRHDSGCRRSASLTDWTRSRTRCQLMSKEYLQRHLCGSETNNSSTSWRLICVRSRCFPRSDNYQLCRPVHVPSNSLCGRPTKARAAPSLSTSRESASPLVATTRAVRMT